MKRRIAIIFAPICFLPSLASANIAYDKVDTNQDGVITWDEHKAMVDYFFVKMDENSDGEISREEFNAAKEKHCKKMESKVQCEKSNGNSG